MSGSEWLSDEAWAVIEPHLPKGRPGARRVDDRRVISGILHVLRSGCRWSDCPPEYGFAHHDLQSLQPVERPGRLATDLRAPGRRRKHPRRNLHRQHSCQSSPLCGWG
jgi:transposase